MKLIELNDLDARPGRLTVWRPTAGARTPSSWTVDHRPASYVQEAHLHGALVEAAAGTRGPSWIGCVLELPGELRPRALESALLGWIDRHEPLRSRLVPSPSGDRMERSTLRRGAVGLTRSDLGEYDDPAALTARVEELFDNETDPLAWPSFVFATVAHADSTTVYLAFDHLNGDGYSVFMIAHEIRELYLAALSGRSAELAEVGSYLDYAGWEREGAALVTSGDETVRQWREFVDAGNGRLPEFWEPLDGGPATVGVRQTGAMTWILDAEGADAFHAACRSEGGSFVAGLLSCFGLAACRRSGNESFRAVTPFHTRSQSQWEKSFGWYVGIAPVQFPVRHGDTFGQVVKEARAAFDRARPLASVPFARVTELLGMPLDPRFMISYMDLRKTPGAEQWAEWNAAALRSSRVHPHEVYVWVMRTHEGVYVSYRYPDTEQGRAAVPRYLDDTAMLAQQVAALDSRGSRGKEPAPC